MLSVIILCLLARPSHCFASSLSNVQALLDRAHSLVEQRQTDAAFATLSEIYAADPDARGLPRLFESCLRLKIQENGNAQDRFGLAALLLDQERYEEASEQLRHVVSTCNDAAVLKKASSMLFRSNAACCHWDSYVQDCEKLVASLSNSPPTDGVPVVHPFEALKWPCISLQQATQIASRYAKRSMSLQNVTIPEEAVETKRKVVSVSRHTKLPNHKIRIGYISPDFTAKHPLAFLMQDVFRHHNRNYVNVKLYSLSSWDESCPEVLNIKEGSDSFTVLAPKSTQELAAEIKRDQLDVLVDLCGYAGTDRISQIMSLRPAPVQVSYMGFPASSGAPYMDYLVCDKVVVPSCLRKHYTEGLIYMPHCYFVNSHAMSVSVLESDDERRELRRENNLTQDAFVYCCHSRPDKIDPYTFRTWLRALKQVRQELKAVLWLLRSGSDMETNLRRIAREEFQLDDNALIFCDVAPREVHLRRLGCADLFLDTPAYNAHTLGCDTLFAGVPMISLLRPVDATSKQSMDPLFVDTEKLASRVGASLLLAAGLGDLICDTMKDYESLMMRCATDKDWYGSIRNTLVESRFNCPLFDTQRWVENLELALRYFSQNGTRALDVVITDN